MIKGIVDGIKVNDKRTYILPNVIINYYKRNGKWNKITNVRCQTTEKTEVITVRIGDLRHTWKLERTWKLTKEIWVR